MASLTGIEPQSIDKVTFMDKELLVARLADEFGYISVSHFCSAFSLSERGQRQRIERHSYYDKFTESIKIPTKGGPQAMLCLRVDALPVFLMGINLFRIQDPETFKTLEVFIKTCHRVLAAYWGAAEEEQILEDELIITQILEEHDLTEADLGPSLVPLEPKEVREIDFIEDVRLIAAELEDGFRYASFNGLCDALHLDRRAQRKRIERNDWYYNRFLENIILPTAGGPQSMLCVRADALPMFLVGVNLHNVKDEKTFAILDEFVNRSHIVLAEYWELADEEQIRTADRATEQLTLEHKISEEHLSLDEVKELAALRKELEAYVDEKLEKVREAFLDLRTDMRKMQRYVGPTDTITEEQAEEVHSKIAELGLLKVEILGATKPHADIYTGLYRRFGVTSYRNIKMKDYPVILHWLDEQREATLKHKERKQE
jgi:hypothetical protein